MDLSLHTAIFGVLIWVLWCRPQGYHTMIVYGVISKYIRHMTNLRS